MIGIGAKIEHPNFGEGVIFGREGDFYRIYFKELGEKEIGVEYDGYEVLEASKGDSPQPDVSDIIEAIDHVFDEKLSVLTSYLDPEPIQIGEKWLGGVMILSPAESDLQAKEIPIETFFHKIVMVRDRLRVLEQQINSDEKLDDIDKVKLQQYITRIYGSLTTFNVLFKYKEDSFSGEKK
ncbi:MAG TPA: hypothetical protein EYN28_01070 [Flavobacteriales bacterium]|jgi:hypothetical protein|nr:hypothetical protein [Flavobacteriales bacterium]HIB76483.1 hypothetical protein [Flavobacteriales bacterium]HIN40838.1 hypothetical protein [Flavobacteriales bacterium]HIO15346.1 hypothetical protein [Flavobacteriales bacterium]HIO58752.1 hypothetical protein [Flavobacteriales bacterium]